jgi:sugar/nucleoside kinase (ribokinase family)
MSSIFDVIVVGNYSVDLIFSGMSGYPQLGQDLLSTDFKMTPGEAYISAVNMHRLGIKVGWAGDFGNDDFSRFALNCARKEGLDETLFLFHDQPYRRLSVSFSYPHDRGFLTYYDPDLQFPAAISALRKSKAKVLYIPGLYYGPLLDVAIKLIHIKKMKLFMDGNSSNGDILGKSRECSAIRKAIKYADIFLPNAQEARRLTGIVDLELAIRSLGALCPFVVIKDGRNGSLAYTKNTLYQIPAMPVEAVDTTGAGDSFNAGFIYAWFHNQSIENCLKWGNITGGLSTTELGGTTRIITADEVKQIMAKIYPQTEQSIIKEEKGIGPLE